MFPAYHIWLVSGVPACFGMRLPIEGCDRDAIVRPDTEDLES